MQACVDRSVVGGVPLPIPWRRRAQRPGALSSAPALIGSAGMCRLLPSGRRRHSFQIALCSERGFAGRAVRPAVMPGGIGKDWPALISGLAVVAYAAQQQRLIAHPVLPDTTRGCIGPVFPGCQPVCSRQSPLFATGADTGMSGAPWMPWLVACYPENPEGSGESRDSRCRAACLARRPVRLAGRRPAGRGRVIRLRGLWRWPA